MQGGACHAKLAIIFDHGRVLASRVDKPDVGVLDSFDDLRGRRELTVAQRKLPILVLAPGVDHRFHKLLLIKLQFKHISK